MRNAYMCGGDPGSGCHLPHNFTLLPAELRRAGYRTHLIGKWHLGMRSVGDLPVSRGFDSSFGYLAGGEDYYSHAEEGGACKNATRRTNLWQDLAPARGYGGEYSAFMYARRAAAVIAAHPPAAPLFLYLAMQDVHWPLQVPRRFLAADRSAARACARHDTPATCPTNAPGDVVTSGDDDC
eukprot:gene7575-5056_t